MQHTFYWLNWYSYFRQNIYTQRTNHSYIFDWISFRITRLNNLLPKVPIVSVWFVSDTNVARSHLYSFQFLVVRYHDRNLLIDGAAAYFHSFLLWGPVLDLDEEYLVEPLSQDFPSGERWLRAKLRSAIWKNHTTHKNILLFFIHWKIMEDSQHFSLSYLFIQS